MFSSQKMDLLEARIQHQFRNRALLEEALTHPSTRQQGRKRHADNQRLEFLGDAVLQLILSEILFQRLPNGDEGLMTKLRTRLVSERPLASMARTIGLGDFLWLGKSEDKVGGRERDSILSDAFEALTGAIYQDGSFEAAQRFVLHVAHAELNAVLDQPVDINPKGELQELLERTLGGSPTYKILREDGPAHKPTYEIAVFWKSTELGEGKGFSKKDAEIKAAIAALAGTPLHDLLKKIPSNKKSVVSTL